MTPVQDCCHILAGAQLRIPQPHDPFRVHTKGPMPAIGWRNAPDDPDELARYRWWIGHHLAFCVWRLLSERLASIANDQQTQPPSVAASIAMYDVYSVLLLYAGSCSPEVYLRTIRPAMVAADPAFSGRWARDYEAIPGLLRTIRRTRPAELVAGLLAAARTNQVVHMAVGKRLVHDGPSLAAPKRPRRRPAGHRPGTGPLRRVLPGETRARPPGGVRRPASRTDQPRGQRCSPTTAARIRHDLGSAGGTRWPDQQAAAHRQCGAA